MAKSFYVAITGVPVPRRFSAENIITTDRASSTTTTITYSTGSTSTDVLTFTHAADADYTVVESLDALLDRIHNSVGKRVTETWEPPLAISAAALA
jgi:hypothetical protein